MEVRRIRNSLNNSEKEQSWTTESQIQDLQGSS